jgi:nucleotide-binding universal stress UspA family protein
LEEYQTVYQNILVAVDDSEQSNRALKAACELARLSGGNVQLFHVRERQDVVGKGGGSFDVEYSEEAEALLRRGMDVVTGAGVTGESRIVHAPLGHVASEIIKVAHESEADTIVMGSHGRGGIAALVLGSNAYKVLHLADRPVLIVR